MDDLGKMNKRVQVKRQSTVQSASGHEAVSYALDAAQWAAIEWKIGGSNEDVIGGQFAATTRANFTIAYDATITESDLIYYESKDYQITALLPQKNNCFLLVVAEKIGQE